jgi:hypothetical protein
MSTDHMPPNPITAMVQAASGLHEFYSSCVEAGFTADQAMELTKTWMIEMLQATFRE